jgi:hypothetical protein
MPMVRERLFTLPILCRFLNRNKANLVSAAVCLNRFDEALAQLFLLRES